MSDRHFCDHDYYVHTIARQVHRQITDWIPGGERNPRRLYFLARKSGCYVRLGKNITSSYEPMVANAGHEGVMCVNTAAPYQVVVRRIAHELTHHLMFWGLVKLSPFFRDWYERMSNQRDVEEDVCCAIEDLILPLPFSMTRTGKMIIIGDGVFRSPRVLKVTVPSQSMPSWTWGERVRELE